MPNAGAEFPVQVFEQNGVWVVQLPDAPYVLQAYRNQTIPIKQVLRSSGKYFNPNEEGVQDFVSTLSQYLENIFGTEADGGDSDQLEAFQPILQGIGLGGSGGSKPPEDPIVSKAKSFYRELWGIEPPKKYVENFFDKGGDYFDFTRQEFGRPGAENSPLYRNQATGFAAAVSDIFGRGF